jgi:hypothetical protein
LVVLVLAVGVVRLAVVAVVVVVGERVLRGGRVVAVWAVGVMGGVMITGVGVVCVVWSCWE